MNMRHRAFLAATLLLLGGCASKAPEPEPPTGRQSLDRAARLAFDQGHYAQAGTLYGAALEQALLEDDPAAIVDARFNLALAYTYLGRHDDALDQVAQANAERQRRALADDPGLLLLEATIQYRGGRPDAAQDTLERLFRLAPPGGAVDHRGHFLAGLVAVDRDDPAALQAHIDALRAVTDDDRADLLELQGSQAGAYGDVSAAYRDLDQAIVLRGMQRDYRGMARVLARAGGIAAAHGDTALAAGYFLRAGRSAAQRAEPEARVWLEKALALGEQAGDSALQLEAGGLLRNLDDTR